MKNTTLDSLTKFDITDSLTKFDQKNREDFVNDFIKQHEICESELSLFRENLPKYYLYDEEILKDYKSIYEFEIDKNPKFYKYHHISENENITDEEIEIISNSLSTDEYNEYEKLDNNLYIIYVLSTDDADRESHELYLKHKAAGTLSKYISEVSPDSGISDW